MRPVALSETLIRTRFAPSDLGGEESDHGSVLHFPGSPFQVEDIRMRVRRFFLNTVWVLSSFYVSSSRAQEKAIPNSPQLQQQSVNGMSLDEVRDRANRGDAQAQWVLGNAYMSGHGVPQDDREAARWYKAAAAQSLAAAEVSLGYLYEQGRGVTKDSRQAFRFFQAAALGGDPIGENNLASLYEHGYGTRRKPTEAARWYLASAQAGNPVAQSNLASMYFLGTGIHRDPEQAARWFHAAADQGFPEAQNLLAVMYYKGDGVPRDYPEAARWARRAAEQGYVCGEADLAYMYEQGRGVPLDYVAAYSWYSMAAAGGEKHSANRMKSLARLMSPEQLRVAEWQAAERRKRVGQTAPQEGVSSLSLLPRD
jgi:TPR repeat protein